MDSNALLRYCPHNLWLRQCRSMGFCSYPWDTVISYCAKVGWQVSSLNLSNWFLPLTCSPWSPCFKHTNTCLEKIMLTCLHFLLSSSFPFFRVFFLPLFYPFLYRLILPSSNTSLISYFPSLIASSPSFYTFSLLSLHFLHFPLFFLHLS